MAYLEKGNEFWKCEITGSTTTISTGTLGTPGKKTVKTHASALQASDHMGKQRNLRMHKGFVPRPTAKASTARAKPKAVIPAAVAKSAARKRRVEPEQAREIPPAKRAKAQAKASSSRSGRSAVDSRVPNAASLKVVGEHSVKLNQTNVGANNNKFYIIQVLQGGGSYYAWNRWGRVGDDGQNKLMPCSSEDQAIREFEKKFQEKTLNRWADRASFVKKAGKYTIVETEDAEGGGQDQAPMGKLTEAQIGKGQAVLDRLGVALKRSGLSDQVGVLSSEYYSLIPHNFGWKKPPAISTMPMLEQEAELMKFYLRMGFEKVETEKGLSPISGVMGLPCPKSLDEAARSICSGGSVASSNAKGRELATKQAGSPARKMDAHLYAAIMLYTSNAIYAALNKCLRDEDRAKIKKYFKYMRLLFEAMDTLPKQNKTLWRGISVDLYGNPDYSVGKTVTWWGISSCTSEHKVAQGFANGCGGNCTLVTVQSKSACDISKISFYGNEKESLLRPGTQLKVKSKTKKGSVAEITLQEIGCAID